MGESGGGGGGGCFLSRWGREVRTRDKKNIILNPAGTRRTDNPRGLRPRFRDRAKERALLFTRHPQCVGVLCECVCVCMWVYVGWWVHEKLSDFPLYVSYVCLRALKEILHCPNLSPATPPQDSLSISVQFLLTAP